MNIYMEHVLEHYREPKNNGELANPDVTHKERNTICGDEVEISMKFDGKIIKDIKFKGAGCAISQASASMITDHVKGRSIEFVNSLDKDDVMNLIQINLSPVRLKCALLALDTIKNAILIREKYILGKNGR